MKTDKEPRGMRHETPIDRPGIRPERYEALDPIFHERSRLSIMTVLAANSGGVPFTELRDLCGLTDGNLSRHVHKLAGAGLVKMEKQFIRGVPNTTIQVTAHGVEQFSQYVEELAWIVDEANRAMRAQAQPATGDAVRELRECP
ncbi:MAG TPA: transcriptional regulator [Spirochaetia bacterium]|nr:transcriptional regulator [Spirochaetia bacterium]